MPATQIPSLLTGYLPVEHIDHSTPDLIGFCYLFGKHFESCQSTLAEISTPNSLSFTFRYSGLYLGLVAWQSKGNAKPQLIQDPSIIGSTETKIMKLKLHPEASAASLVLGVVHTILTTLLATLLIVN